MTSAAAEAAEEALNGGFRTWRVETAEEVLQLQVTKSGEATVHRARQLLGNAKEKDGGGGGVVKSHDRVKPRLLAPSDPFLVHVGVGLARCVHARNVFNSFLNFSDGKQVTVSKCSARGPFAVFTHTPIHQRLAPPLAPATVYNNPRGEIKRGGCRSSSI